MQLDTNLPWGARIAQDELLPTRSAQSGTGGLRSFFCCHLSSSVAAFRQLLLLCAPDQLAAAEFNVLLAPLPVSCWRRLAAAVASTDIIEDLISYGAAAAEFVELDGWTAFHVSHHIYAHRHRLCRCSFIICTQIEVTVACN